MGNFRSLLAIIIFAMLCSIAESQEKDYFPLSLGYYWEYNAKMQRPSTMTMEVISCDTIDTIVNATIRYNITDNESKKNILAYNVDYEKIGVNVYNKNSLMFKLDGNQFDKWEFFEDSTILFMELADTNYSYYYGKKINDCFLIKAQEKNGSDNFCQYVLAPDIGMVRVSGDVCLGLNLVKFRRITDVIETEKVNYNLILSPNPATDYIEIKLFESSELSESCSIRIFNTIGECVIVEQTPPSVQESVYKINISDLPAGIYFLKTRDKFYKFVKM